MFQSLAALERIFWARPNPLQLLNGFLRSILLPVRPARLDGCASLEAKNARACSLLDVFRLTSLRASVKPCGATWPCLHRRRGVRVGGMGRAAVTLCGPLTRRSVGRMRFGRGGKRASPRSLRRFPFELAARIRPTVRDSLAVLASSARGARGWGAQGGSVSLSFWGEALWPAPGAWRLIPACVSGMSLGLTLSSFPNHRSRLAGGRTFSPYRATVQVFFAFVARYRVEVRVAELFWHDSSY